jgi:hypothetical protein
MWLFRKLYKTWVAGGVTEPSPIGTVLIIDSVAPKPVFDFFHCLETGTVGIDIGEKFIIVFLWDQADGTKANLMKGWDKWHLPRLKALPKDDSYGLHCYMAPHVWACECAYWLYRNRRSFDFVASQASFALVPPVFRRPERAADEVELRAISRNFGLELTKFGGETGHIFDMRKPAIPEVGN